MFDPDVLFLLGGDDHLPNMEHNVILRELRHHHLDQEIPEGDAGQAIVGVGDGVEDCGIGVLWVNDRRTLGEADGLPALPDAEYMVLEKPEPDAATAALAEALASVRGLTAWQRPTLHGPRAAA